MIYRALPFLLVCMLVIGLSACKGESASDDPKEDDNPAENADAESSEGNEDAAGNAGAQGNTEGGTPATAEDVSLTAPREGPCDRSTADTLEGTIKEDRVLPMNSCFKVTGQLQVEGVLNIMQGSTLLFENQAVMFIGTNGALVALGTEAQPVRLVGVVETPGFWRGLVFKSSNPISKLQHVEVLHGGGDKYRTNVAAGLVLAGQTKLSLEHVRVAEASNAALAILDTAEVTKWSDCTLESADQVVASVHAGTLGWLGEGTYKSAKDDGHIEVKGNTVNADATWRALGVPYKVDGDVKIEASVQVEGGANFLFEPNSVIFIAAAGSLQARGTTEAPISFKGFVPGQGVWRGIVFKSGNPLNALSYTQIEGGGSSTYRSSDKACLFLAGNTKIRVEHVSMSECGGYGLAARDESEFAAFVANQFADNELGAALLLPRHLGSLDTGSTFGNGLEAPSASAQLRLRPGKVTKEATWPAIDAPYVLSDVVEIASKLNLSPGAQLRFETKGGLLMTDGVLTAEGTAEQRIGFAPLDDQPWVGLVLKGGKVQMGYVDVVAAGSKSYRSSAAAALYIDAATTLSIHHSQITKSSGWGIFARPGATIDPPIAEGDAGVVFADNALGDLQLPE